MLEKRKNFGPLYLQNDSMEKLETWHVKCSPWETSVMIFFNVIVGFVLTASLHRWTLYLITMKIFEYHLGWNCIGEKKLMTSLVTWFGSHIVLNIETFKNLLWNSWIGTKFYSFDHLSRRNKKFSTYDIIGHMVWQPHWIYPEISKDHLLQNGFTDQGESSATCSQSLADTRVFTNN